MLQVMCIFNTWRNYRNFIKTIFDSAITAIHAILWLWFIHSKKRVNWSSI